jgi:hypothetical protein
MYCLQMGDSASASLYTNAAISLNATLFSAHVSNGFVQESPQRVRDGAVIVALNDGYVGDILYTDDSFAPTHSEVASTVATYNDMFCEEYAVNRNDYSKGLPGVLYGRYKASTFAFTCSVCLSYK